MRPQILGIVNITADSFSDGGRYLEPQAALAHAHDLAKAGADILDLGAASSHPDATAVSAEEEIARLEPVLPILLQTGHCCSLDSYHTQTQRWALGHNIQWLNDIQGFADARFYPELAQAECQLIVMHNIAMRGKAMRQNTNPKTIYDKVARFFTDRLEALTKAGIAPSRLVLDPGMGFFLGTDPETSLTMMRACKRLRTDFGIPILLSVSRKSFLWKSTQRSIATAGPVTLAAELWACLAGVAYLRTHDVAQLHDSLKIWDMLTSDNKL